MIIMIITTSTCSGDNCKEINKNLCHKNQLFEPIMSILLKTQTCINFCDFVLYMAPWLPETHSYSC